LTSEVVLGNGFGVVLCADSFTTRGDRRTYDGARKIIGLEEPHRVGVLHSNAVNFHGVPYETLLENWLHGLPDQRFATMIEYAESFASYLSDSMSLFMDDTQSAREYLQDWRRRLHRTWRFLKDNGSLDDGDVREYFEKLIADYSTEDRQAASNYAGKVLDALGRGSRRNLLEMECHEQGCNDSSHSSLEGVVDHFFADEVAEDVLKLIYDWVRLFSGLMHPTDADATLVFVGYAGKDALPSLVEIRFEAIFLGRLFYFMEDNRRADREGSGFALFATYGQSNEIWRFIREAGLNPHYSDHIVAEKFSKFKDSPNDPQNDFESVASGEYFGTETATESVSAPSGSFNHVEDLQSQISGELEQVARRNIRDSLASFASMNLKNLSSIAQRFVQLQNLSLDLRGELPTVGGPLMTAVITPQHGFVMLPGGPEDITFRGQID